MANVRDLNRKINSLRNMQKIMRAMNMIASIKLKKLLKIQDDLNIFSKSIKSIEEAIQKSFHDSREPVIKGYKTIEDSHIVFFTADKGLCGSHNTTIKRAIEKTFFKNKKNKIITDFTCIGKKGVLFCRQKGFRMYGQTEIHEKLFTTDKLKQLTSKIFKRFLNGEIHNVIVVYNKFVSTIQQETVVEVLLPLPHYEEPENKQKIFTGYTEPEDNSFLIKAAEQFLFYSLQSALLNSHLSEHAARMTAMENATNNSDDLIYGYSRARNRARQALITKELIEIISGKEAMKE